MVSILDSIVNRRSIRRYTSQPVEKDKLSSLLQAAMSAPSACNQQTWHFVIIEDKEVLSKISKIHSGFATIEKSPVTILVCGEPRKAQLEFFWRQDCAAATQNILIAAKALGLGAVWMGIHPDGGDDSEIIREAVKLPEYIYPFSLVSVGYPDEVKKPSSRYDENKVHYGSKW